MSRLIHAAARAAPPRLRVRWRSGMVPNFELLASGQRGFVGVRANHSAGDLNPVTRHPMGALESHDDVEDLPPRKEYLDAIVEEHLWACDEPTGRAAANHAGSRTAWREYLADDLGNKEVLSPAPPADAAGGPPT